ncbi:MAG: ribbon-helix-helix domain-containing protein [Thermoproteota archaeon]
MVSLEEEFNQFKDRVRDTFNRLFEHLKTSFSRVSEIEGRIWLEKDSPALWDLLKEVKEMKQRVKDETRKTRESILIEFRAFRKKVREDCSGRSEELGQYVEDKLSELRDFLDNSFDEVGDRLDEFLNKIGDVEEKIRSRIRELKEGRSSLMTLKIPGGEVRIPDIGKLIENSLSKAWSGMPSMVVSSVRLPKADLELIDALVEAGIFKSRNEGIAFFAHKGIEASREWLNKVREKIEEIKRLQEEAKREMEKIFGEEKI